MADCNIRNISNDLMRRMKTDAAERGWTLRQWSIEAFEHMLDCSRPTEKTNATIEAERALATLRREKHAETCKCFICKPPKP